jgi:hypothetical protein
VTKFLVLPPVRKRQPTSLFGDLLGVRKVHDLVSSRMQIVTGIRSSRLLCEHSYRGISPSVVCAQDCITKPWSLTWRNWRAEGQDKEGEGQKILTKQIDSCCLWIVFALQRHNFIKISSNIILSYWSVRCCRSAIRKVLGINLGE